MSGSRWTKEEIDVIRKYFPSWGAKKCKEYLPNRAISSIQKKAQNLGVRCNLIEQRRNLGLKRKDLPKGFYEDSQGYLIYTPTGKTEDRVLYHRYVLEQHLGRRLTSEEIVHHKDGNKKNNDISNLELTNRRDHMEIHRHDLLVNR